MLLAQKICIFPSNDQQKVLWGLSEKCRLLYNFSLQNRKLNWIQEQVKPKKERKYITYNEQSATLSLLKQKYPQYKWEYSKVLQQVLKKLNEILFKLYESDLSKE